jgi:phosphoenolpyruvate phosphomutase
LSDVTYVDNDDYACTGELNSLFKAISGYDVAEHGFVVSYGDVLFRKYILDFLCETNDDLVIVVDTEWRDSANRNRIADYVRCSLPPSRQYYNQTITLEQVGPDLAPDQIHGESIGFLKIGPAVVPVVARLLQSILSTPGSERANMPILLNELVERKYPVRVIYTSGNWCDVDSLEDVVKAGAF